jgi:hypothetical protein
MATALSCRKIPGNRQNFTFDKHPRKTPSKTCTNLGVTQRTLTTISLWPAELREVNALARRANTGRSAIFRFGVEKLREVPLAEIREEAPDRRVRVGQGGWPHRNREGV